MADAAFGSKFGGQWTKGLDEALTDYDVTLHLLPLPLSVSNAYAPVRNSDFQTGREDSGFKGYKSNRKGKV